MEELRIAREEADDRLGCVLVRHDGACEIMSLDAL